MLCLAVGAHGLSGYCVSVSVRYLLGLVPMSPIEISGGGGGGVWGGARVLEPSPAQCNAEERSTAHHITSQHSIGWDLC